MNKPIADERLIIALDLPGVDDAESLVTTLGERASAYKIGYQLAPVGGYELARALKGAGKRVFLDLKFHDIGATVEKGVRSVREFGADLLTVHATPTVVKAAVAGRGDDRRLKLLAVTVLTDQSAADVAETLGADPSSIDLREIVLDRARMAIEAGADGVVASPKEAGELRAALGPDVLIVTPGIRPAGADAGDQKRVASPSDALKAGASHLVVGRPITEAEDPGAALDRLLAEMREAS